MFQHLLESIAQSLDARHLPYMVIGGQAVLLYGEPRLTRDIDITLGVTPERLPDLLEVSRVLGLQVLVPTPEQFVGRTMVLPCLDSESGVRVDFIFSNSSFEQQALERVRSVRVGHASVNYASLEDLVIYKVIAGRPRDLEDVRTILAKHPEADMRYIRRWLKEFESGLEQPFVKRFDQLQSKVSKTLNRHSKRKR